MKRKVLDFIPERNTVAAEQEESYKCSGTQRAAAVKRYVVAFCTGLNAANASVTPTLKTCCPLNKLVDYEKALFYKFTVGTFCVEAREDKHTRGAEIISCSCVTLFDRFIRVSLVLLSKDI